MTATGHGPRPAALSTTTDAGTSLDDYRSAMRAFLADEITATEFERRYIDLFGDDTTLRPEETFRVLNDLFFAVDAFCPDPGLREADDLDEAQLQARVRAALAALPPG